MAKRLLKNGADPNFQTVSPQPKSIRERTPLHAAVITGNLEMTKVLLEYGPNTNIQDELGQTPLLDAVLALSWNRVNEPEKVQESHDIAQLLVEA
ncbi:MAG: ankyrin repeat domain-containing protein, partial [Rhodobacteraceae bacterium]|nr:ankyrin repeat domain-containing protein [Paracoccaceae bacterium]